MKNIITAALIAMTAAPAMAGVTTYGKWSVVDEVDELTGERETYIVSYATTKDSQYRHTRPFMGIHCKGMYFGGLDVVTDGWVTIRANNMPKALSKKGSEWEGSDGTSIDLHYYNAKRDHKFWKDYKGHFKHFIAGSTVMARFSSYARQDQTIKVSLSGFGKAIDKLQAACMATE